MSTADVVHHRSRPESSAADSVPAMEIDAGALSARGRAAAALSMALRLGLVLGMAACLAGPWINQQLYWLGWIGLGGFLYLHRYVLRARVALWTLLYATTALGIAFHWAPAAMAYTVNGGLMLGAIVMLPILLAEAVRLAFPFFMVRGASEAGAGATEGSSESARAPILPQWLALAVFAVALETLIPTVFPWRLGYLQAGAPILNQFASIAGPAIGTFSVFAGAALVCSLLAYMHQWFGGIRLSAGIIGAEKWELWSSASFVGLNLAWGAWMFSVWEDRIEQADTLKVSLVQVDPSYTDSLDKMRQFTRQADGDVDLVCWPESSVGCYSVGLTDFTDRKRLMRNSRMPLRGKAPMESPNCEILAGGRSYEGPQDGDSGERVSAFLIDRQQRVVDRYDKTRLMPFGEYVPGAGVIPGLTTLFGFGDDPPAVGASPKALATSSGDRVGVMMCYEDLIPNVSAELVRDGAQVLVVLINGTAFKSPIPLLQHRQLAAFRAVENRRYLVRTASTGSTCVIDPLGRVVAELPIQTESVLQARVGLLGFRTPFSRTGDVLGWACVALAGLFLWRRRLRDG